MKPERPILRYHGGKWLLAPWIISHFPSHRVYVEPFGGAASVLLQKGRSQAEVYNDLDDDTVNVFRVMRDHRDELKRLVDATPFARAEFLWAHDDEPDPVRRAFCTLIRSFQGCSPSSTTRKSRGGWRNSVHESVGVLPSWNWADMSKNFDALSDRMSGVLIENRAGSEVIRIYDAEDALHYVDPPYVASTRRKSDAQRGVYRHEMTDEQHRELAAQLHGVSGMVALSGYHSALYDELYAGWNKHEREALAERAGVRTEVLWFNPAAWDALHRMKSPLFA